MSHPVKARGQKQCLAFTKERRRCRLERNEGSKTCHIHRNYYYQWAEKELPKLKYCHWDTLTKRNQKEITFQLKFRHVILNQEDVEKMFWNFTSVDGYERLILLGAVEPFWVKPLFKKILDYYMLDIIEYLSFHGGFSFEHKYQTLLEALLPFPDVVHFVFHYLHYRSILTLSQSSGEIMTQQNTIGYLWQISLTGTIFRQCLWNDFDIHTYLADMKPVFLTMFHCDKLYEINDSVFINTMKTYERLYKKVVEPFWKDAKHRLFPKPGFSEELFSATITTA
jgi:hypothetical protein